MFIYPLEIQPKTSQTFHLSADAFPSFISNTSDFFVLLMSPMRTLSTVIITICMLHGVLDIFGEDPSTGRLSDYRKTSQYYNELHRPQFHFTPPMNWMNDPNGMV